MTSLSRFRERFSGPFPLRLVIGIGLLLRLLFFFQYLHSPLFDVYRLDHLYYRTWGLEIAGGDWWGGHKTFEQGPIYAYFLGILYTLFGARDAVILAVQLLLGTVTSILVYAAARRLFGPIVALVAGLIAALYGPMLLYEGLLMKSFLAPLLTMTALLAVIRYRESGRVWWLTAGAAIGFMVLKREIHLLLLVPMMATVWGISGWRRRGRHMAVLAVSFLLAIAPFTLRNLVLTGEFVPTTTVGGEVFYISFGPFADGYYRNPPFVRPTVYLEHQDFRDMAGLLSKKMLTRKESSAFWFRKGLENIRKDPGHALRLMAVKFRILCNDFEVPDTEDFRQATRWLPILRFLPHFGWIFGFGIVGLLLCLVKRGVFLVLPGFVAAFTIEVLLSHNLARYRLGMLPVMIILAGYGAVRMVGDALAPGAGQRRRAVVSGLCALLLTWSSFTKSHYWDPSKDTQVQKDQAQGVMEGARIRDTIPGLRQSLRAEPGRIDLHYELALALERTGRVPEAVTEYRETLRRDPAHAEAWWRLADILQTQGRPREALSCMEKVLDLQPEEARAHKALGILYSQLATDPDRRDRERYVKPAVRHFRESRRLAPADPVAPYLLGKLYYLLGARAEARVELFSAVILNPDFTDAWYLLDRLPDTP